MVEPVHHLLDNARLNLVVQSIEGEIGRGAHDVESGVEIVGPVGEDKGAGVDEAENEVKRRRSERGRGEREAERLTGLRRRAPCDECVVKVRGTGDEDEAVSREDGCGAFVRGRGAFDGDVHVRLEPGAPHEDQVFPELIDPVLFRIALFAMLRRVEEKLECLSEALAGVEVLELFGEESRIYGGLEAEDPALICGGDGRCGTEWGRRARDGGEVGAEVQGESGLGWIGCGGIEARGRDGSGTEGEVARLKAWGRAGIDDGWRRWCEYGVIVRCTR